MPDRGQSGGWRKTVVLKDLLSDDDSDDVTRKAAEGFAARLKRLPEYEDDFELEQLVSEFSDIAEASSYDEPLCEWFNAVLSGLYDWADAERVWIGGTRQASLREPTAS